MTNVVWSINIMVLILVIIVTYVCVYLVVYYDRDNLTEVETPGMIDLLTNTVNETSNLQQPSGVEQHEEGSSSTETSESSIDERKISKID